MRSLKSLLISWLSRKIENSIHKKFDHPELQRLCSVLSNLKEPSMYALRVDDWELIINGENLTVFLADDQVCEQHDIPIIINVPEKYNRPIPASFDMYMYIATAVRTLHKEQQKSRCILIGENYGYIWWVGETVMTIKKVRDYATSGYYL